jgi:hypothetical protein
MRITYAGPSLTGVELPLPDGRIVHVEHAEECPVDLPTEFARTLLDQQSNWQPAAAADVKAGKGKKE